MNILPNGTQWALPPRTAARYTANILWHYGLDNFSGHEIDFSKLPDARRLIMNVRNPFTRFRSWWRIYNDRLHNKISCEDYILNLHSADLPVTYTYLVDGVESGLEYKYPIPLHFWYDSIRDIQPTMTIELVAQEQILDDLIRVGYPDKNKTEHDKASWEDRHSDKVTDWAWYKDRPACAEIVWTYYETDFSLFKYSNNLNRIYDGPDATHI